MNRPAAELDVVELFDCRLRNSRVGVSNQSWFREQYRPSKAGRQTRDVSKHDKASPIREAHILTALPQAV